jgi:GNAT superfamily N-acetyltransferase
LTIRIVTVAERPGLAEDGIPDGEVWPEYILHGDATTRLWRRMCEGLPAFQFVLVDGESEQVLAEGHTVPCWWDRDVDPLGSGIDQTLATAFERLDAGEDVNTRCAVAAEVPPRSQGRGLARALLEAMGTIADRHALTHLIATVRPSWKERFPVTPIERYITWRRGDGRLLDPWMRVHENLGARVGPAIPRSLQITGTVEDWDGWTGLLFPETGSYVFPHGLALVDIDRTTGTGRYWEPNVWMIHR